MNLKTLRSEIVGNRSDNPLNFGTHDRIFGSLEEFFEGGLFSAIIAAIYGDV